jgi:hypothetical protein
MTLHALARADRRGAHDDQAQIFLRAHLDARHYGPCLAAAPALPLPAGFDGDDALCNAAALTVAQTFGLLDAPRDAAATALVRDGLAGAADAALARGAPDAVLLWCTAAAEWCERNGLDHACNRLAPRAAIADADASAWTRVHWRIASAWHHEAFGRRDGVATLLAQAQDIAAAAGDMTGRAAFWSQADTRIDDANATGKVAPLTNPK